ncbi:MAG: FecR domain-containing protein [Bacteroidota bacterium]
MTTDTNLSPDDRDLRLAQHLGAVLDDQEAPSALDADDRTLLNALTAYREAQAPAAVEDAHADALWAGIADQMAPAPAAPKPRLDRAAQPRQRQRISRRVWASALASVIVLAALAWFTLRPSPAQPPLLVAEAGAEALVYQTPDGSDVTLRPHTRLYRVMAATEAERYQLEGEAYFEVVRNPERTFQVEAEDGLVSVLGTSFNVSTWGDAVQVYLSEGRVRFESLATGADVTLAPGEQATLADGQVTQAPTAPDAALDWMQRTLAFEQQPLQTLLDELSQHYRIGFEVDDVQAAETLTGQVQLDDDAMATLDALGIVLGGRFEEIRVRTYRFVAD